MDITQTLITVASVLGIIVVGLMAIVPAVLELPAQDETTTPAASTPLASAPSDNGGRAQRPHRHHHDLAA